MKTLLLIDGNAILHRAYHAYPPNFTDNEGNPTNAIYGFYAMLIKLLQDVKPEYLAICFDRGAPTFRMNMYVGYHANRPKMSDDLAPQVPRLQESLEEIGIPLYGVEGYEADDLLGSLASQAVRGPVAHHPRSTASLNAAGAQRGSPTRATPHGQSLEVIIVTGDRDLLQLVNPHVKILMPLVGITKTALFDEDRVEEKYGIKPSQFIDYKALVGDASDNYPGVTGIGPKGAATLLQKYGSFEDLYKRIGELPEPVAQKLALDAEQASLAKKLATIQCDAPVHLRLKDCDVTKFTTEKFLKVFEAFNIHSLARRLLEAEEKKPSPNDTVNNKKARKAQSEDKTDTEQLGLL